MTLQEELIYAEKDLQKTQDKIAELKAWIFFDELIPSMTYSCKSLAHMNPRYDEPQQMSFGSFDYKLENNNLVKDVRAQASHFKTMDDSQDWPSWKNEAVKQAQILQSLYNKRREERGY